MRDPARLVDLRETPHLHFGTPLLVRLDQFVNEPVRTVTRRDFQNHRTHPGVETNSGVIRVGIVHDARTYPLADQG